MKTIKILKLKINNFKGIKSLSLDFNKTTTSIYGANATGKTSIFDAVTWLLFGKDSQDRKEFEIKNTKYVELNRQDHQVVGVLDVDGDEIELKKIFRERWVKQRGSLESTYVGNETLYYWNDLPLKQSEYQDRINNLVEEKIFKLITNPLAFNSLKWQDRRQVLIDIAGDVKYEDIAASNPKFQEIIIKSAKYNSLEEYKKAIAESVKRAKEDLKAIPTRIDEVLKNKPEPLDFESLEKDLRVKENELHQVEGLIFDKQKAFESHINSLNEKRQNLNDLRLKLQHILNEIQEEAKRKTTIDKSALNKWNLELNQSTDLYNSLVSGRERINQQIDLLSKEASDLESRLNSLRDKWTAVQSETINFDLDDFKCPTCRNELPQSDIEKRKSELTTSFNQKKLERIQEIDKEGARLKSNRENCIAEIEKLKNKLVETNQSIQSTESTISLIKASIEEENNKISSISSKIGNVNEVAEELKQQNTEIPTITAQIQALENEIANAVEVDTSELKQKRILIQSEIEAIKNKLKIQDHIQRADARVSELQQEEKSLAQAVLSVEKEQFNVDELVKCRIEKIEEKIRSKFKYVSFRMFDTQINGGETETCITLVDSVPFDNANTAGKINAGLDIINTLTNYYNVNAPVFIDNSESVHTLIDTDSQLIKLVVSENHKSLTL